MLRLICRTLTWLTLLFGVALAPVPLRAQTSGLEPTSLAARATASVYVERSGLIEISAAALRDLGFAGSAAPRIGVVRGGVPVHREVLSNPDGSFAALRFFAPPAGDRWNNGDTYWLIPDDASAQVLPQRQLAASCPDPTGVGRQFGQLATPLHYQSLWDGPDGDHWFRADLDQSNAGGDPPVSVTLPISPALPLAAGETQLTLSGMSTEKYSHRAAVTFGTQTLALSLDGFGHWQRSLAFASSGLSVTFTLFAGAMPARVLLDQVEWELPAQLDLSERGAIFAAPVERACLQLSAIPTDPILLDISDPAQPVRLTGASTLIADTLPGRTYAIFAPDEIQRPALQALRPFGLAQAPHAEALYLGPAELLPSLEPLLQRRQTQGISVAAVAVEEIYRGWSYGQIDPEAIRQFIRFAAQQYPTLTTIVLVGDGTSDPRNYSGRNSATLVPPYLAMVDPFIGETACDNCYVMIDGVDPSTDAAPDLRIGRLPVKNRAELDGLVSKIIGYETAPVFGAWRSRAIYLTDNPDFAGDFPALAAASAAQLPAELRSQILAYDPAAEPNDPQRTADPVAMRVRALDWFNSGAVLMTYFGHGQQFQWAYTGPPLQEVPPEDDRRYILGMYDSDTLRNGYQLPLVLGMTCLSGSFHEPTFSGTVIDERLVLNPLGGAIATWSSAGLTLSQGQAELHAAFTAALHDQPNVRIGDLTYAAYQAVAAEAGAGADLVHTFVLLGDPLTPLGVRGASPELFLPLIRE